MSYICKSCGLQYQDENANACVRCQTLKGYGNHFCPFCGMEMPVGNNICMNCGVDIMKYGITKKGRSKVSAGLLAVVMGVMGAHNFYLGYNVKATIQVILYAIAMPFLFVANICKEIPELMGVTGVCLVISAPIILIVFFWSFIEGIMIFCGAIKTDGNGVPLR